jgi:hypothetical protein
MEGQSFFFAVQGRRDISNQLRSRIGTMPGIIKILMKKPRRRFACLV